MTVLSLCTPWRKRELEVWLHVFLPQQYIRWLPSLCSRFVPGTGSAMLTGWVSEVIWMFRREKCFASAGKRTMTPRTSLYQLSYPGSLSYYYNSSLLILLSIALVLWAWSFVQHGGFYLFTYLLSLYSLTLPVPIFRLHYFFLSCSPVTSFLSSFTLYGYQAILFSSNPPCTQQSYKL